jgi:hypothetical protein
MRRRNHVGDGRIDEGLGRLADRSVPPTEDQLRDMARAAASTPRDPMAHSRAPARRPRLTLAWILVAVAAALLVGSGLGFGIASSATPTGEAGTPFEGFGFLPLRGWTVVQGGALGADGSTTATAANVQLDPDDAAGALPTATLRSLPTRGLVVHAIFTTRGDPGEDFKYPDTALPLVIGGARGSETSTDPVAATAGLGVTRIRAGVGSYNVDARVYFGSLAPTSRMIETAQRQLDRLVVASERVSINARPLVSDQRTPITLFGAIVERKAGEVVDIQAKDCGQSFFRGVTGTQTREGGSWSTEYTPGITTTLRAVWNGVASAPVVVRSQVFVNLSRRGTSNRYSVSVSGKVPFWRRQVLLQQRRNGNWTTVRKVVLTETGAPPGVGWITTWADFRASFPRGSQLRAVLPASQAKPCYLSGVSSTVRT